MKKTVLFSLFLLVSFAGFAQTPIFGSSTSGCVGATLDFSDGTPGGVWTSSGSAITISGTSGGSGVSDTAMCEITGVSAGTGTLSYTVGSSVETISITISSSPAAISGGGVTICVGGTATFTDATSGGSWSTSDGSVSSSGVLTAGSTGGTAYIYYSVGGCTVSTTLSVDATVISDSISGPDTMCAGSSITLTNATSGGVWSSSDVTIATVGSGSGIVTGTSSGVVSISYSLTASCGTASVYKDVFVSGSTSAGSISGPSSIYMGSSATYSDGAYGGSTWSSSNTAVVTINATTGAATPVSTGTATISYSVVGCSGTVYATMPVTVSVLNRISGDIEFAGITSPDSIGGTLKVWLITYNTITYDLEATDSVAYTISSSTLPPYAYQFLSEPTDSYRVKAAFFPTTPSTSGYLPTYHDSNFYWHNANAFYHSGLADDNVNVYMLYGAATSGPGFISGDVRSGADRGTSGGAAAPGISIYLLNSVGHVIQQTETDATGAFSFSSLPVGTTYTVFPELLQYATTPYSGISLTSSSPSMSVANFEQHTLSHSITPVTEGVATVSAGQNVVTIFPNPADDLVTVQWSDKLDVLEHIIISDMAGRQVYVRVVDMSKNTGHTDVALSGLDEGLYIISVNGGGQNYSAQLLVKH
jgi:Secretion system C-terminal sorting domain